MNQEKTFKHASHDHIMDNRTKRILVFFLLIVLIIAAFYAYRKLNLMIKEDIILEVDDNYASAWLKYGEVYEFEAEAEINNYWLCTAICKQHVIDMNTGHYLADETFYVTNNKKKTTSTTITPRKGYGQSIYQYEIKCQNIPSSRCPTGNDTYVRKSTLIINHEPNDAQKEIIKQAIYLFNNVSYNTAYSELNIDNATNILYNLDVNFPEQMKTEAMRYSGTLGSLKNSERQISNHWDDDDYESARDKISSIYMQSNGLLNDTSVLLNDVLDTVDKHNTIVRTHRNNLYQAMIIKEMLRYYPGNAAEFKNDAMTSLSLVNINTLKMNKLDNYDSLVREALLESVSVDETISLFESKIAETKHDYVDLYLADKLSCSVIGCNFTKMNYILSSIDDAKNRCVLYQSIMPNLLTARNITGENREGYNGSLSDIDVEEKAYIMYLLSNMQANDSAINSRIGYYMSLLNITSLDNSIFSTNNLIYYSLEFQPMTDSLNNIAAYCGRADQDFSFDRFNIYEQIIPELGQQLNVDLIGEPIRKCCAYGKCKQCGSEKKNPLILLHGHSFNQKNSAYQSTDVFNQLESMLSSEGYVSLGIWKPYADPKNAIQTNVLFKPTYYITTYIDVLGTSTIQSKDESIEEYSERLKNTIDNIKLITGSDKVDIVAHSMGGLVTRRYIQKYGPGSVENLILIGTPNNGITDRVYSACKLFGNEKECDEMHQGSELMKKLNESHPMPKTSLIIGRGCDMQGKDGDGVVTVESSKLDNYKTYYVDGNCTSASFLHNAMLNRQEVADRIMNIVD